MQRKGGSLFEEKTTALATITKTRKREVDFKSISNENASYEEHGLSVSKLSDGQGKWCRLATEMSDSEKMAEMERHRLAMEWKFGAVEKGEENICICSSSFFIMWPQRRGREVVEERRDEGSYL